MATPVFLPGKSHGQRNLTGCSPWGHKESDMTECAHARTHTSHFPVDTQACYLKYFLLQTMLNIKINDDSVFKLMKLVGIYKYKGLP